MWEANENEDDLPSDGKSGSIIKWLLLFAALGVLSLFIMTLHTNLGGKSPAIGKTPTRLDLRSAIDESSVHLADLKGQVVLVNYWGPWCHFCLEEMPHLNELFKQRRDRKDFRYLSVTCGAPGQIEGDELIEQSKTYLRQRQFDFPFYVDPRLSSRQALADLDRDAMSGYPATVILDRQGVVRGVWSGYRPGEEKNMADLLDQLLNTK